MIPPRAFREYRSKPSWLKHRRLSLPSPDYLDGQFADEIKAIPQATIIPVGKAVELALQYLVDRSIISRGLFGFPHPSNANRYRARMFAQRRDRLAQQLHEQFSTPQ